MNAADQAVQGAHPDESRWALVHELAEVEAQIRQAEASRKHIGQAAGSMRDQAHRQIGRIEEAGIETPDNQTAYQHALKDRRTCDLISGMTAD